MALPLVAIVGRPNVGKSSLLNWLAGRRISIVDPTAGVTRDRVSTPIEANGRWFELCDTGGMGIVDHDNLTDDVERQIRLAIEEAAVVLFVVDIRDGVVPLDQTVAERLRTIGKPVLFVANKSDDPKFDVGINDFYPLGYGEPMPVSANNSRNRDELLAKIARAIPEGTPNDAPEETDLKIAVVGRRNAGKSTFINALADEERVIVSEVAGTTRDSVDVEIESDGKKLLVIDTAGVRKKTKLASDIEYYSMHRAERSIRRADVVLHFMDARLRIGRVDKQLTEYIVENHKPAIFVINKWDLVKHALDTAKMAEYVRKVFRMLDYVPICFLTAKSGKNATRLLQLARQLFKQSSRRVGTGILNRLIRDAIAVNPPPTRQGNRQGKVFYVTQVAVSPPTVAFVVNDPELFDEPYVRYLTKALRDNGPFPEVPLKVMLKARGEGGGKPAEVDEELIDDADGQPESRPIPVAPKPPRPKKKKKGPKTWEV
jgi:GTP-binding protein